jgi:hypothetical protein
MLNVPPEEPATTNSLSAPSDIFARSFIKLAVSQDANYTVPPDMLTDKTSKAIADLIGQLDRNRSAETEWTRRLIDRFEALSGTVLSRKQQVANSTFGALRIMAICLAAEADALQSPKIGDEFRGIAAGISWIEGRLTGGEASAEIIVLAASWTL